MHFLFGLWFLLLCCVVTALYLLVPCLMLPLVQQVVAVFKPKQKSPDWPLSFIWLFQRRHRKSLYRVAACVVLFYVGIYTHQRLVWMGNDNANLVAKEYFVAGQPLAGVRQVLCEFLNPESPVLVPLNSLQKMIYQRGIRYLPEDDGERGVWADLWFYYPYIRRMHKPYGTNDFEPAYAMRELLDGIYDALRLMATGPMADQQMEREKALWHMPRLALYFLLYKGHYEDKRFGSGKGFYNRKENVDKIAHLYQWIVELRQRWQMAGIYPEITKNSPKVEVTRQMLAIHLSGDLLYASIFTDEFSCRHPVIPEYLEALREFVDPHHPNYVWGKLYAQQPQTAEDLYGMTIDSYSVSFNKYILEHYCNLEVPGEERFYNDVDKGFAKKQRLPRLKSLFHEELDLLEEKYHGQ
jgi:hypothetical protein